MIRRAERYHSQRAAALDRAYDRLQQRVDKLANEGSRWVFLLQLLIVGFWAALFAGAARSLFGWTLEAARSWRAG